MNKALYLNTLILIGIALAGYALTMALSHQPPGKKTVTIAPVSSFQNIEQTLAPDFTFKDTQGNAHKLSDFKGKIILLNFWASWCAPCVKEFPYLIQAAQDHPDDVILIALSSDIKEGDMQRFITKLDIPNSKNIFIALDKDQAITANIFKTFKLPETIIITKDMRMQEKIIGADWDYSDLKQRIELLQDTTENDS